MPEVPIDSSFVKELPFIHIVAIAFMDERGKLELSVWAYQNENDAKQRFERLAAADKQLGKDSRLVAMTTFLAGIYENFEQSLFSEKGNTESDKVM